MPRYVETAVAAPVRGTFHYRVPEELEAFVVPGTAVRVWFGRRRLIAYALSKPGNELPPGLPPEKVRPIIELSRRDPGLSPSLLPLARWMAKRYFASIGETIQAMLPAPVRRGMGKRRETFVLPGGNRHELEQAIIDMGRSSPRQAAILEVLAEAVEEALPRSVVLKEAAAPASSLDSLAKKGLVRLEKREPEDEPVPSVVEVKGIPVLTGEQRAALETIRQTTSRPGGTVLLFGITGSGKTELYLRSIKEVVDRGGQAIVLVPEISLTPQTVERFRARFKRVAVLHSNLTPARRARYWESIHSGEVDVVIGARSAVFAPLPKLELIVVDEEHETTYKQENAPRYHAVEVASKRAELEKAGIILGSATPSVESLWKAKNGTYELARLHTRPAGGALPPVEVVDMRSEIERNRGFVLISRRLKMTVEEALKADQQVILFLNRRGFSTRLYCPVCGYVGTCPQCDVPLTYHRHRGTLLCHFCDHREKPPENCPVCGSGQLLYLGTGTERVEEVLESLFPEARIGRLDSDVTRKRSAYFEVLGGFRSRSLDILVGTQMIAKGLDFPHVSLVGVINADIALNLADFRAAERTVQIISQVSGRAGRASVHGHVVVQSGSPDNPALSFASRHDYAGFAEQELDNRRNWGYPPFSYLGRAIFSGKERARTAKTAEETASALKLAGSGVSLLGPAPCIHEKIRGMFRYHLLIKADSPETLEALLENAQPALKSRRGVTIAVDVNPFSLL